MKFGDRLKSLRDNAGLSRQELADKLNISYSALSKYETNNRFPDRDTLIRLADFFDVTLDYLACRTDINTFKEMPDDVIRVAELFAGVECSKAKVLEKLLRELLEK